MKHEQHQLTTPYFESKNNFESISNIVTMGPFGTDAQYMASKICSQVELSSTFDEAMKVAYNKNMHALIPCGYVSRDQNDNVNDTWVDLHFRWSSKMQIVAVWPSKTKEMALAVRGDIQDASDIKIVAIHPATQTLVSRMCKPDKFVYCTSKPEAFDLLVAGRVDACLASRQMVATNSMLQEIATVNPVMVWALYFRVRHECE